jgi:glucuronate isomerase
MSEFLSQDFLLQTETAKTLYHEYAKALPIIDYHNHLSPELIAKDYQFKNITEVWLSGDHYKWRAMRAFGVDEKYITGEASDEEKFMKWAEVVPHTLRNPLYHWTHLELKRYFGINKLLSKTTAKEIWKETNKQLSEKSHSANALLKMMKVEVLCTTDDPTDSLDHHKTISKKEDLVKTLPTFRPDKAYAVEQVNNYQAYLKKLVTVSGSSIENYAGLIEVLKQRIDYFDSHGCRLADHGLEQLYAVEHLDYDIEVLFGKLTYGEALKTEEIHFFKTKTLQHLSQYYHEKGWTQQFHLGAIRDNNSRLLSQLGPDTGFDSIGDFSQARALSEFFNTLDSNNQLARTILYNLNPSDNEVFATMAGNYNDGSIKGKMQFGSAWWFLDQKDGMEKQINALSNLGLLSCFVGMLTDSRSFLSFPRHEYFRRILCNMLGNDVANGEVPDDMELLGNLVKDICYRNAKVYFGFGK